MAARPRAWVRWLLPLPGGPSSRASSHWLTKRAVASSKTSLRSILGVKPKGEGGEVLWGVAEARLRDAAREQPILAAGELVADERREEVDRGLGLALRLEQARLEGV